VKSITLKGKEFKYMGYEDVFLKFLVHNLNIKPRDITTKAKNMPAIWYDNMKRKYTPDIAFKHKGNIHIVEIKSVWTMGLEEGNREQFQELRMKSKAASSICNFSVVLIHKGKMLRIRNFHSLSRKKVNLLVNDKFGTCY
jgi:hypothetical protein